MRRWLRRLIGRRTPRISAPAAPVDTTGTDLVLGWIDSVVAGLTHPPSGPPEAAPARACDGLFTAATVAAVLIEKVRPWQELKTANHRCLVAAVEFMKALGEETLRTHRIAGVVQVAWNDMTPEMDTAAICARMIQLGETLQLALLAVTTDVSLSADVRDVADDYGLPAADTVIEAFDAVRTGSAH